MNCSHTHDRQPGLHIALGLTVGLALAGGCSVGPSARDQELAARQFNVGVAHMAEARFAEAESAFNSARALVPGEPCYVLAAGQARMNQANYDSAALLFEQAVALDSTLEEGWFAVAFLALRQARNEDALTALRHCADDAVCEYLRGIAHSRLDRPDQAAQHLARSLALDPHFISAQSALAQLYQRTGQDSLAAAALGRFTYLRDHGGTSVDLGGDIGTGKQGPLDATPIPYWRRRPIADERPSPLRIRRAGATWPTPAETPRAWVTARIADLDGDGWDDLVLAAEDGVRLWRNEGDLTFADITAQAGLPDGFASGGGITSIAVGDVDGNGRPDLLVAQSSVSSLWRQTDTARVAFSRDPVELPAARAATWADLDGDGLLDLVLVPLVAHHGPGPALGLAYWRNRGGTTFADYTDSAGVSEATLAPRLEGRTSILDVQAADWDQDGDVDLLLSFKAGGPAWLENQHDGRFVRADGAPALRPVPLSPHLGAPNSGRLATNAAVGDFIPNGWLDVATGGATGLSTVATTPQRLLLQSDAFPFRRGPDGEAWQVRSFDLDLDGDLDLVAFQPGSDGIRIQTNQNTGIQWEDRTSDLTNALALSGSELADLRIGSLNDPNVVHLFVLPRRGPPILLEVLSVGQAARIRLVGGRGNRQGVGALVDIAQGYHWQRRRVATDGPGQSGRDLIVGLPRATRGEPIDMIRVTWPSGIRQSVLRPSLDTVIAIVEKPGETSSCPFVYTWDGERFAFVGDAIGTSLFGARDRGVPPLHIAQWRARHVGVSRR